ncbi:cytidine deaminase [Candidatus Gottesmanbacteria bacterium]|nr:cytidine deaminase [Candidatus Gottesmanbacteria bacterium]
MTMTPDQFRKNILLPTPKDLRAEFDWISQKIDEIGIEKLNEAIRQAVTVRKNAYPPYSGYKVGAAIISTSGAIHASCNAEVASYSETDHAEGSAITKAISEGEIKKSGDHFIEAVIVSHTGKSGPCGRCRQSIGQHCENALIIDVDEEGNIDAVTSLKALFFYAFTPKDLQ